MTHRHVVVVSDLDGTLLDHQTYSAEAVRPALGRLIRAGIGLVLSSSKTRAEIEVVQRELGVTGAFISENGGGVFLPAGLTAGTDRAPCRVGAYELVQLGLPYADVVGRLRRAAEGAGVDIRGFADMTAEEVAGDSGLSLTQARLAKARDFDEPFRVLEAAAGAEMQLARSCSDLGLALTRGGRYHHASGPHDKGAAIGVLREVFARTGTTPLLVGFGDGLNDAGLLAAVDRAFIVRGHDPEATAELCRRLPGAGVTPRVGPAGVASVIDAELPSLFGAASALWASAGAKPGGRAGEAES